jgi:hypothetical protein
MAGKHVGVYLNAVSISTMPGWFEFNPKVDKAYAEGRAGSAPNGNPSGSPASLAWNHGDTTKAVSTDQFETATR